MCLFEFVNQWMMCLFEFVDCSFFNFKQLFQTDDEFKQPCFRFSKRRKLRVARSSTNHCVFAAFISN